MNQEPDTQYVLVLTKEQTRIVNSALDLYSRIGMGQLEIVAEKIQAWTWKDKCSDEVGFTSGIRTAINTIKAHLGHPPNDSYGIFNNAVPADCRTAFDIVQVIRHSVASDIYAESIAAGKPPIHESLSQYMPSNPEMPKAKCYGMRKLLKGKESLDTFVNVVAILTQVDEDDNGNI